MTIKEKILKIMSLALEINPPEIDHIGENKTALFVRWFPHCNGFEIDIHYGGWRRYVLPDEKIDIYTDREDSSENLDKIIERLENIKADIDKTEGALNRESREDNNG